MTSDKPPTARKLATRYKNSRVLNILSQPLILGSALLFFYLVPIKATDPHPILDVLLFSAGLIVLIVLITRQLQKQLEAGDDPGVRIRGLITLLYPVVVLFALGYYIIWNGNPAQFENLATRTDALYYSVVTLGTVGYGDIHAVGALAKWITMIQIAFDLVVVGALIAVATTRFQVVPRSAKKRGGSGSPEEQSPTS